MSEPVRVIRDRCVEIERLLTDMGGDGRGLGEKYRSLDLPESLQRDLRQIAHLRNTVMHDGVDLNSKDMERFERLSRGAIDQLKQISALETTHQSQARVQVPEFVRQSQDIEQELAIAPKSQRRLAALIWFSDVIFPLVFPVLFYIFLKDSFAKSSAKETINITLFFGIIIVISSLLISDFSPIQIPRNTPLANSLMLTAGLSAGALQMGFFVGLFYLTRGEILTLPNVLRILK